MENRCKVSFCSSILLHKQILCTLLVMIHTLLTNFTATPHMSNKSSRQRLCKVSQKANWVATRVHLPSMKVNPGLPERHVLGLWMIWRQIHPRWRCEEGHNRYCRVARENFLPMAMIPFQYKKMVVHKKFLK
jgi:hypothetical protein